MAPVLDARGEISGFVLTLEDITRAVEAEARRDGLVRQLTEGSRAALANIRAAIETIHRYPDMDAEQRQRFVGVIHAESEALSQAKQREKVLPWLQDSRIVKEIFVPDKLINIVVRPA